MKKPTKKLMVKKEMVKTSPKATGRYPKSETEKDMSGAMKNAEKKGTLGKGFGGEPAPKKPMAKKTMPKTSRY